MLASTLACAPLPELSSGMCGNYLVEEGEACDGLGTYCIMPP